MSTPTVLPATALTQLASTGSAGPTGFVGPALARAGLYLTPILVAMAAGESLARLPPALPVAALITGWCALAAFGYLGRVTAARSGASAAARLVLAGFAAVATLWAAVLPLAPPAVTGDALALAYAVSLPALGLAAAVGIGQATGTEPALLRWSLPAVAVAATMLGGWQPGPIGGLILLAALALPVARAMPLTWHTRGLPHRPLTASELRRGTAHLLLGASQAVAVLMAWQAGESSTVAGVTPVLLPLILLIPLIEMWVGWHVARVAAGLAHYDDRAAHHRYVRRLGWVTLTALLPPLVASAALAATAHRLPYGLSTHPDAPALVLAMATGVLLAGVAALGWLLAARQQPALAALLTGGPALTVLALVTIAPGRSLTDSGELLPALATALAVTYAVGLAIAAQVLFDSRAGAGHTSAADFGPRLRRSMR